MSGQSHAEKGWNASTLRWLSLSILYPYFRNSRPHGCQKGQRLAGFYVNRREGVFHNIYINPLFPTDNQIGAEIARGRFGASRG
jgi:hypothetical protein